jgi:TonB family protein
LVSGAIGKVAGEGLLIATGGGGDPETKSVKEIGAVGRVESRNIGTTVRARVTAAPNSISGEGHLDRGEIQKVVNAHMYQIQNCYERQLIKDPSLSGKVVLEWTISGSGGVAGVRVRQSSLSSNDAATCMQAAVGGWRFPPPQGGNVTVNYPFNFRTVGQ